MEAMIFSMSAGAKPPLRASSAKRSRIALRVEKRGMKKVMVDADQMTRTRKRIRRRINLRVLNRPSPTPQARGPEVCILRRTPPSDRLLLGLMQARHHKQAGLSPESSVRAHGEVVLGRPVGPVG